MICAASMHRRRCRPWRGSTLCRVARLHVQVHVYVTFRGASSTKLQEMKWHTRRGLSLENDLLRSTARRCARIKPDPPSHIDVPVRTHADRRHRDTRLSFCVRCFPPRSSFFYPSAPLCRRRGGDSAETASASEWYVISIINRMNVV